MCHSPQCPYFFCEFTTFWLYFANYLDISSQKRVEYHILKDKCSVDFTFA